MDQNLKMQCPIENGDIPASYVSLPEGKFNKYDGPFPEFRCWRPVIWSTGPIQKQKRNPPPESQEGKI